MFPTLCDLLEIEEPDWLQGRSLMPLVGGDATQVRDALFVEKTFHVAYEPERAVRTPRWKYIRRFDETHRTPVLANCDDGPSKSLLIERGWGTQEVPAEQLYDLTFDPNESCNSAGDSANAAVLDDLRGRLDDWMAATDDPLRHGPVTPPAGVALNAPSQTSPADPTTTTTG